MDKEELKEHKEHFLSLLRSTSIPDVELLIEDLEHAGFFTSPASMKNHLCYEGGLMIHSLNVYEAAIKLRNAFKETRPDVFERISDESIIIAALLHDVCKAGSYFRKRNAQMEFGQAEYGTDYGRIPIGHGEKSTVMLLRMGLDLRDDEICAIRWHMGAWSVAAGDSEERAQFRRAQELYPLVTLIQLADTAAAQILERKYETINS